jgi:hypothetical protein
MVRPVGTDPVNATLLILGCSTIAVPTPRPEPVTTLSTPGQGDSARRRHLGRLHDHGIARRQCRSGSPRGLGERDVPGRDDTDDPVGLADRVDVLIRRDVESLTVWQLGQAAVELEVLG